MNNRKVSMIQEKNQSEYSMNPFYSHQKTQFISHHNFHTQNETKKLSRKNPI